MIYEYLKHLTKEEMIEILEEIKLAKLIDDPDLLKELETILLMQQYRKEFSEKCRLERENLKKQEEETGVVVIRQENEYLDNEDRTVNIKNSDLYYRHGYAVLKIDFFESGASSMQPHRELNGYGWVEIGISSKDEKEFLFNLGKILKDFSIWRVPPLEIRLFNAPKNLIPVIQVMVELSSLARKVH